MSNSSPCPSAVPRRARSTTWQTAKRDDENVNKIAHGRRPLCPQGQTVCGVEMRGGTSMRGWECINIQTDLESCELTFSTLCSTLLIGLRFVPFQ